MDGVGTPIIGRPRPLPGHDTPNPAYHPHTLNYEEPVMVACANEEFQNTNYEKFNKSMSQIMDSLELMMYIPTANQN